MMQHKRVLPDPINQTHQRSEEVSHLLQLGDSPLLDTLYHVDLKQWEEEDSLEEEDPQVEEAAFQEEDSPYQGDLHQDNP